MSSTSKLRVSLQAKLLIMVFAIVSVATTTLGSIAIKNSKQTLTEGVFKQLDSISQDLVHQVNAINEKELTALIGLANVTLIKDPEVPLAEKQMELTKILKRLNDPRYENLAFYDKDGNAITSSGDLVNFSNRAYYIEAMKGNTYISEPTLSPVTNSVLQQYSVPVIYDNKPVGALVLLINGNLIYDTIKQIDLGGGMHPAVISRATGTTIANANENTDENSENGQLDENSEFAKIFQNIFAGATGNNIFVDPSLNKKMVCSYRPIDNTAWSIFAVAPYDYYFASLKKMQVTYTTVLFVILLISALVSVALVGLLIKPLKTVKKSIEEIASGNADLTQRIPAATNDEIGDVVNGFNSFVAKLQSIVQNLLESKNSLTVVDEDLQCSTQDASASITQIIANIEGVNTHIVEQASSVHETAGAVNEISSNIESLEKMIANQSMDVAQASSAVEQMIGNINAVNSAVEKMVSSFEVLEQNTSEGISSQANAYDRIHEIEEQSKMLQDANTAIASIAEQTNLLAMNAAIEAAHAGEAGKGFSVVADEIRKLSETSSSQSKTISSELAKIRDTIRLVVEVSTQTNTAFNSVSDSIAQTSQIIAQIKGAMEEQQAGSKQIIDALSSMNNSTSEVKVASSEMTEGSKQILGEISKLQSATDIIKQSVQEMKSGAERINATGSALTEISGKVTDNIKQIGDEIGLFKV